ncbi:MAG TPA: FixH family protein [Blastocatellia bacterium]|nr:FixH family protein [Blastocatellia bacterium]
MRTTVIAAVVSLIFSIVLAGCSSAGPASTQKEIAKQRSGDYVVTLLNDTGQLKQGENAYTLEFRKASDNSLVDVGPVTATTQMPMPGMSNMVGDTVVTQSGTAGRYNVKTSFGMKGSWTASFTYGDNQKVQLSLKAQ